MIKVGVWRWPLIVGLPCIAAGLLFWKGLVRPNYEARGVLTYSRSAKEIDAELHMFRSHPNIKVVYEKVSGKPLQLAMRADGSRPTEVVKRVLLEGQASIAESLGNQKAQLRLTEDEFQKQVMEQQTKYDQWIQDRKTLLAGPKQNTPRAQLVAKIEQLKTRRNLLIERYPTHSDIPMLANQIQNLLKQLNDRHLPPSAKITELDRRLNETKVRRDYFSRRLQETAEIERSLKPSWTLTQPIQKPQWPNCVDGWQVGAGVVLGVFGLGFILFKADRTTSSAAASNGLWKPETTPAPDTLETPEAPVQLEVVSPEAKLPSDPLTEKAAALYGKWVEVAKILYQPAPEPPQGVLDSVGPLLQESSDFLPDGHDVLAKYLARSVTPGDLAAHVARTVLMTLTGAQEAGVSPEHRLAMALAALFHDLAVVPRPAAIQEEVGSEVGRLSASVLRRIPDLQPALLSMVEEILIGMDEFKLETWQNVASGSNLEPLSKVLREIDRFEKVMQKQKSRLDRRVANQ